MPSSAPTGKPSSLRSPEGRAGEREMAVGKALGGGSKSEEATLGSATRPVKKYSWVSIHCTGEANW